MEIIKIIQESINLKKLLLKKKYIELIGEIGQMIIEALRSGHKILVAGNGGSAADAEHFVSELVGYFNKRRKALSAVALASNPSIVTSIANDLGYKYVFARQIEALGKKGDIFVGISTSGNSVNIIEAVKTANNLGLYSICLLGKGGGKVKKLCQKSFIVPSNSTQRIQEVHGLVIHIICEMVDEGYE